MENNAGFITLSRKFFRTDMWKARRTYNESEAWLDCIATARFELSEQTTHVGGHAVTIRRGELALSQRTIAKKWGWTDRKVRTFIQRLHREGMIETEIRDGITVVKLINYDKYNYSDAANDAANDAASDAASDAPFDAANMLEKQHVTDTNDAASDAANDAANDAASDAHNKKEEKREEERKKDSPKGEPKERNKNFLDFFNSTVEGCSIPSIKGLSEKRVGMLNARIKDYGIDAVHEVVRKAAASSFLNGRVVNGRSFIAKFDWIFRPNNFLKVLEGNYDDRDIPQPQSQQSVTSTTDDEQEWYPGWKEDQLKKIEAGRWQ